MVLTRSMSYANKKYFYLLVRRPRCDGNHFRSAEKILTNVLKNLFMIQQKCRSLILNGGPGYIKMLIEKNLNYKN